MSVQTDNGMEVYLRLCYNGVERSRGIVQDGMILSQKRVEGNTNTGLLKMFALIFMVMDHVGAKFFPGIQELRILGRIAFPLYLWCAVVGMEYTRNHWRYALRIFVFALISQPFYMLGLGHDLYELNVMFTILFGILGLIAVREKRWYSHIWGPVLAVLAGCILKTDYGWRGILLLMLLYAARKQKSGLGAVLFAFCLFWGTESSTVQNILGIPLKTHLTFMPYGGALLRSITKLQFMAVLSMPFILWNNQERTRMPKWLGYAAYPGHLAIIALIRYFLG